MCKKDASQEALEQVEKLTETERAKGEDLLGSEGVGRLWPNADHHQSKQQAGEPHGSKSVRKRAQKECSNPTSEVTRMTPRRDRDRDEECRRTFICALPIFVKDAGFSPPLPSVSYLQIVGHRRLFTPGFDQLATAQPVFRSSC
jgi:hypothetical protein